MNYDHPKVMLFQKSPDYSSAKVKALLDQVPMDQVIKGLRPIQAYTHGLMLSPQLRELQQAGGTWSEIVQRDSLINHFPALAWWLMAVLLGWAVYPLAWAMFGRLGDRGYGIAKILAIALLAWGAWFLASFRVLPYSRGTILLVLALMVAGSAAVVWRRRAAFWADVRARWELLLFAEVVFAAAFVFFHGIRMAEPGPVALELRRRKADGLRLPERRAEEHLLPALRSVARGRLHQLLLLRSGARRHAHQAHRHRSCRRLQPGGGAVLRARRGGSFSFAFNFLIGPNGRRIRSPASSAWAGLEGVGSPAALFVAVIGNLDGRVQIVEGWARRAMRRRTAPRCWAACCARYRASASSSPTRADAGLRLLAQHPRSSAPRTLARSRSSLTSRSCTATCTPTCCRCRSRC